MVQRQLHCNFQHACHHKESAQPETAHMQQVHRKLQLVMDSTDSTAQSQQAVKLLQKKGRAAPQASGVGINRPCKMNL
jgi:hypothetical protein